ncbi:hypothetical protein F4553_000219 [Allocatelliglobosispora scoriae]|uniref:DUF3494 domain-containing protein n=1 Tax=Allocatelliglobosispora scoriae TaxID=643052 RepID=A0A841BJ45_9ACTN|nr:hypothetical protein [Allocatelliglobosispora scoriae]MBB5866840.1 hypothetical protein [Allocatelliglobosispora scoriae]
MATRIRAGGLALAAACVLLSTCPRPAVAAQTAPGAVACPVGVATQSFTPAVTTSPQTVQVMIRSHYGSCLSGVPGLTSGDSEQPYEAPGFSCLTLLTPNAAGTETIVWNTGQTTTLAYTAQVLSLFGQVIITATGTVTSGLFLGAATVRTVVYAQADLLSNGCLAPSGLSGNSGPLALTATGG